MDGSPFYTLPVIKDLSTGQIIGDSFDIALYLDKTYPNGPSLFPPSTIGLQRAFNTYVDATFTAFVVLCGENFPFNPETAEVSKATFARRAGKEKWEDLMIRGEERVKTVEAFRTGLDGLAKAYSHNDGPFLEGKDPSYADFIVGGCLAFFKGTTKEWVDIQTWHDGLWGKLHLALEKYAEVK
ncbi:hypothetical protein MPER_09130 [Moniliophthora perniciosa FA553]|nr:hypothetical protein MPER_09130 [Moniliophthora perniciosa FA553]